MRLERPRLRGLFHMMRGSAVGRLHGVRSRLRLRSVRSGRSNSCPPVPFMINDRINYLSRMEPLMSRILPPIVWLICALLIQAQASFMPVLPQFPGPIAQWAGLSVFVAGLGLLIWAWSQFVRVGTNINTFRPPDQLVIDGAFAWTRNPMYLGFLLTLIGGAIWTAAPATLIWPFLFFSICHWHYIPFEEKAAANAFGEAYQAYRRGVRRWI